MMKKKEPVNIKKEKLVRTNESNLMYNRKHNFIQYKNDKNYIDNSLKTKYKKLALFNNRLKKFKKHKARKEGAIIKKKSAHDNAVKLCNIMLSIYFNGHNNTANEEKKGWMKNMILVIYF